MQTIPKQLLEKTRGTEGCDRCGGSGQYLFEGVSIFCNSCHTENDISSFWKSIDSYLAKTL